MTALKTYLPALAKTIGKNPSQLNEWLRALVAAKVLVPRKGKGPGSGVELSAQSLSAFILALLSGEVRNEAVALCKLLAGAKPLRYRNCPVSKAPTLVEAMVAGLSGGCVANGAAYSLYQIIVHRYAKTAILYWYSQDPRLAEDARIIPVGFSMTREMATFQLDATGVLYGEAIAKIAADLAANNDRANGR